MDICAYYIVPCSCKVVINMEQHPETEKQEIDGPFETAVDVVIGSDEFYAVVGRNMGGF